ncbi:MAG: hypothetical protein KAH32_06205 [Chlamydiia bacterium]|nr:hypothetical protein [Chlamydiia bacterium]
MHSFKSHLSSFYKIINPEAPKDISLNKRILLLILARAFIFISIFLATKLFKKISSSSMPEIFLQKPTENIKEEPEIPIESMFETPERVCRLKTTFHKEKDVFSEHSVQMLDTIKDIMLDGSSSKLYNVPYAYKLRRTIDILKKFQSISEGTILNEKVLKYCTPIEELLYESMIITELLMQESFSIQYKNIHENNPEEAEKDLSNIFRLLAKNLKENKERINDPYVNMERNSYGALLSIKELYKSNNSILFSSKPKYTAEFLKNLNIVLYMIYRSDFDNLDKKFISKVRAEFSTYFLNDEHKYLVKSRHAITAEQSRKAFIKTFKRITE